MPRRISDQIGKLVSIERRRHDYRMVKLEAFLELFLKAHAICQPARDFDLNQALFAGQGQQTISHRLHEPPQIISSSDARALAETLEVALKDLPAARRKELRPTDTVGTFVGEAVRDGPDPDSKSYLSWKRRWIVVEFIALCLQGDLEVRRM